VINVSDTTRNQGSITTAVTTVTRFYWSANYTLDAADVAIGERLVGPLGAGESSGPVSTPVAIPAAAVAGSYYIIAKADAGNALTETSETNNTRYAIAAIRPDLIVSTLVGPKSAVAPGQLMTISETTTNQGTVATVVRTPTRFYLSTNWIHDAGDVALGDRAVEPLGPGSSSGPASTSVTVPPGTPAGSYYIIAKADADNLVQETSEANTRLLRVYISF
jgi:uncharacterized membrane protein